MRSSRFVPVATLGIWLSFLIAEKVGDYLSLKITLSMNPGLMSAAMQSIGRDFVALMHGPGVISLSSWAVATIAKWAFALLVSFVCAVCLRSLSEASTRFEDPDRTFRQTASPP